MAEAEWQAALDEWAVRKVLDEYCLRLELDEFDRWLDLFTDDSIYEVYGMTLDGRDKVAEILSKAPHGLHIGGPARITVDGDTAETVQSYAFVSTDSDDWNGGWYYRRLVRQGRAWKIAHTKVKFARKGTLPPVQGGRKPVYPITFS